MDSLIRQYELLIKHVSLKHLRNIYNVISWDARLIGIKGERGVGKTTLMLQRIVAAFPDRSKAIYVTMDDLWFAGHTLMELAQKSIEKGITHLFLDEVHRMPGWERQVKNVYDFCPQLSIVFTGSSLLEIDHSVADLSRRCLMYSMPGFSFREYLEFDGIAHPVIPLHDILYEHTRIASDISAGIDIIGKFNKYLRHGFYPFYTTCSEADYLTRVNNIVPTVIDYDIPAVESVEYATLLKIKHLLNIMAAQTPSPLNATALARMMETSQNQIIKLLALLDRAHILRLLYYKAERNPKSMAKPQKVLIGNPSIAYALGHAELGKVRESFLASMLSQGHEVAYPREGDLIADGRYVFEVGGKGKGFSQVRDIHDSFVVMDGLPVGMGNKIPLWMFGFLY